MELLNVVQIHDGISMNSEKGAWIKLRLETLQGLAKQMAGVAHMQPNVVP